MKKCNHKQVILIKEDEQAQFQIYYCSTHNLFIDGEGYPVEFKTTAFMITKELQR